MPFLLTLALTGQLFQHLPFSPMDDLLISFLLHLKQECFPTNMWFQVKELSIYSLFFLPSFLWFEKMSSEAEDKGESQMECQIFISCLKSIFHSEVFMKYPVPGHTWVVTHSHERKLQELDDFSPVQGWLWSLFSWLLPQVYLFPILPSGG